MICSSTSAVLPKYYQKSLLITPRWKATVFASVPQSARYVGPSWSEGVFLIDDDDDDDDDNQNVSLNHGEKMGFCGRCLKARHLNQLLIQMRARSNKKKSGQKKCNFPFDYI